jgi:hypothetical protein
VFPDVFHPLLFFCLFYGSSLGGGGFSGGFFNRFLSPSFL